MTATCPAYAQQHTVVGMLGLESKMPQFWGSGSMQQAQKQVWLCQSRAGDFPGGMIWTGSQHCWRTCKAAFCYLSNAAIHLKQGCAGACGRVDDVCRTVCLGLHTQAQRLVLPHVPQQVRSEGNRYPCRSHLFSLCCGDRRSLQAICLGRVPCSTDLVPGISMQRICAAGDHCR